MVLCLHRIFLVLVVVVVAVVVVNRGVRNCGFGNGLLGLCLEMGFRNGLLRLFGSNEWSLVMEVVCMCGWFDEMLAYACGLVFDGCDWGGCLGLIRRYVWFIDTALRSYWPYRTLAACATQHLPACCHVIIA